MVNQYFTGFFYKSITGTERTHGDHIQLYTQFLGTIKVSYGVSSEVIVRSTFRSVVVIVSLIVEINFLVEGLLGRLGP